MKMTKLHHNRLLKVLELLKSDYGVHGSCNTLETFGKQTFAFIVWKSTAHRAQGELLLAGYDFKAERDYSPGTVCSQVRVSTVEARKLKTFDKWGPYKIK